MRSNQAKRLDKIEGKLRQQLEGMQKGAMERLLNTLPVQDRGIFLRSMARLMHIPDEHKSNAVQLSQHFTQAEIDILNRVDALLQEPRYTSAHAAIQTLQVALAACETVRG